MNPPGSSPQIVVLAGTNGAGKSSVAGEALRQSGGDYFNPDEVARRLRESDLVIQAIERRLQYAFETTLGGRTIIGLLLKAANVGIPVRI